MAKKLSKLESIGILQQSKASNHWDAVAAANAAFKTIQWLEADNSVVDPGVTVDQFNVTSQVGSHFEGERFFIDGTSGLVKFPFSGTCDKTTMAAFLVAALQTCVESATTPYNKVITPLGKTGVPNWAGNEGYLFTMALKQGASADDGIKMHNGMIDTLNIIWEVEQSGKARLVNMNGTWVFSDMLSEQTLNGTWVNTTPAQTGFFNNTDLWTNDAGAALFTIDSVDYSAQCKRRVELQINNNIRKGCVSTGGKASNYIWTPEYKLLVTIDHNDVTEKIHKDFIDGADVKFSWSNDAAGALTDGKWSITINDDTGNGGVGKLMSVAKGYQDGYIVLNLDIKCFQIGDGTYGAITMYFCDTIDWAF